jgi:hypothetical protein
MSAVFVEAEVWGNESPKNLVFPPLPALVQWRGPGLRTSVVVQRIAGVLYKVATEIIPVSKRGARIRRDDCAISKQYGATWGA